MVDILGGITAATHALDLLKKLKELDHQIDVSDLKFRIAELIDDLSSAKITLTEAHAAIREKDDEIAELRRNFARKADTVEYDGYPYDKDSSGNPSGRPYCPSCLEKEGRFFRLVHAPGSSRVQMKCPNCRVDYAYVRKMAFTPDQPEAPTSATPD